MGKIAVNMDVISLKEVLSTLYHHMISTKSIWNQNRMAAFVNAEKEYQTWLLIIPERGSFSYEILDYIGEASYGDLVFCPPNVNFKRKIIEPLSFLYITFTWTNESGQAYNQQNAQISGKITIQNLHRLSSNIKLLHTLTGETNLESTRFINHIVTDMINVYEMEQQMKSNSSRYYHSKDPLINNIISKMKEDAFGPIYLRNIAREIGLTPVQFTRRFKSVVGITPITYIQNIRLEKAQMLLLETSETINVIASECGYDDPLYFSRLFSRRFGINPSHFRKRHSI